MSGAFTEATLHSSRRLPDAYRALLEDYYLATLSAEAQAAQPDAKAEQVATDNDLASNGEEDRSQTPNLAFTVCGGRV